MLNIIVLGAPCAGKGTQSLRLASFFNLNHISTGELFRKEIVKQTKVGKLAQYYIDRGELVPDDIVLKEIYKSAAKNDGKLGFVFDGFPRTLNQALILDKFLKKKNINISVIVYIDVDEKELVNRMFKRCRNSDRSDDSIEILEKRIKIYKEQTFPLLQYYETQQKLIKISGMACIEDVFENIKSSIITYWDKIQL